MKKICVFLSLLLCLSLFSVTAFAAGYQRGDVDGNGKVTAADARKALRFSAQLEQPTDEQKAAADVNGDRAVTAVDARIILRVVAELDVFPELPEETTSESASEESSKEAESITKAADSETTTASKADDEGTGAPSEEPASSAKPEEPTKDAGQDTPAEGEYPEDLQRILDGHFFLYGVYSDGENPDEEVYVSIAVDGDAVMTVVSMDMVSIGFLKPSGSDTLYMMNPYRDTITEMNEELIPALTQEIEFSYEDFLIFRSGPDEPFPVPVVTDLPEAALTCYTFTYEDGTSERYYLEYDEVLERDVLVKIEGYDNEGNLITNMDVYYISEVLSPEQLETDYYQMQTTEEFLTDYLQDVYDIQHPSYNPDDEWDREYYYEAYWSDGIDWDSIEAVRIDSEADIPGDIEDIESYRTMSGAMMQTFGPYVFEDDDGEIVEFYTTEYFEYQLLTDGNSVRMDMIPSYGDEIRCIQTTKTDLFGQEKEVYYMINPASGIYTELNESYLELAGISEAEFNSDMVALEAPDDYVELTMKTAVDEEGKEHILLTYLYEDGSGMEVLFVDGQLFRESLLNADGVAMEVIRCEEASQEPLDEDVFSLKGLIWVLPSTFVLSYGSIW